ncbi:hypothetical protein ACJZ2D_014550 [Fusarium nematophilum]
MAATIHDFANKPAADGFKGRGSPGHQHPPPLVVRRDEVVSPRRSRLCIATMEDWPGLGGSFVVSRLREVVRRIRERLQEPHNLAGPFILVNRLLPLLKNAAAEKDSDVTIISISSTAQNAMLPADFKFQLDTPTLLSRPVTVYPWSRRYTMRYLFGFDAIRYSVSKASIVLFIKGLQRRLDAQGIPILAISVHPGEVNTGSLRAINGALLRFITRFAFLTPEQGAASPIFVATAQEARRDAGDYKGKFLEPVGKISTPNPVANDEAQVRGLWENTTVQVNLKLASEGLPPVAGW